MSDQLPTAEDAAGSDEKWKFTVGNRPHTMTAEERPDRDGEVYVRWQERRANAKGQVISKPTYLALGMKVRDERGRLGKKRQDAVRKVVREAQARYAAGCNPRDCFRAGPSADHEVPRTLAEGFREALPDPKNKAHTGSLFGVRTKQAVHLRSGANHVEKHLTPWKTFDDITDFNWTELCRAMAKAHLSKNGPGFRTLLRAVEALTATWVHLHSKYPEDFPACRAPAKLTTTLKAEWERITGVDIDKARNRAKKRLRHTPEEVREVFKRIGDIIEVEVVRGRKHKKTVRVKQPVCDPRVRTLMELGAELRQGQVEERAMRSHLDLQPIGAFAAGRFYGSEVGKGKKYGQDIDLHPELREHLDEVLEDGYLADLEAAFQAGEISDYPLFPGGKLVNGRVPLERVKKYPRRALSKSQAIIKFHEYESRIGIASVPGRAYYGIRRSLTDEANDLETDSRVLNSLTGHAADSTSREIYLDKAREKDQARAAVVRRGVRLRLVDGQNGDEAPNNPDLIVQELEQVIARYPAETQREFLRLALARVSAER